MARQQKSEFVSGLGTGFEIIKSLSDEVNSLGGDDDSLRQILSNRTLRKELAKLIVGNNANVYPISVVGTIEQQVVAGNYNWSNSDISDAHFTADQPHDTDVILCHFDKDMSTDAVLKALDEKGLRPATMSELLAVGIQHSKLQLQFPIIALGSVWQFSLGRRDVGYLHSYACKRKLYLTWIGHDWHGTCRFAAVRK